MRVNPARSSRDVISRALRSQSYSVAVDLVFAFAPSSTLTSLQNTESNPNKT